jgi:hypothetical protein
VPINRTPENIAGADFFGDNAEQDDPLDDVEEQDQEEEEYPEERDYRGKFGAGYRPDQDAKGQDQSDADYDYDANANGQQNGTPERYQDQNRFEEDQGSYEKETNVTRTTAGNGRLLGTEIPTIIPKNFDRLQI